MKDKESSREDLIALEIGKNALSFRKSCLRPAEKRTRGKGFPGICGGEGIAGLLS